MTEAVRRNLDSVQVLRGLAASAVVVHHVANFFGYAQTPLRFVLFDLGKYGVNVFFVLSGFIILYAHRRDLGRPAAIGTYLWKRFIRVYPMYWIVLSAFIVSALVHLAPLDFPLTPFALFQDYALLDLSNMVHPPLKVGWTLFYEIQFYVLFCAVLAHRRAGIALAAIWALAIFLLPLNGFYPKIQSTWNVYFLWGLVACVWLSNRRVAGLAALALALLTALRLAFVPAGPFDNAEANLAGNLHLVVAPFLCAALVLAVEVENRRSMRFPAALRLIGDASYAIYLVHSSVISLVLVLARKLLGFTPRPEAWIEALALLAVALAAGVAAHFFVEKPLLRLFRPSTPPQANHQPVGAGAVVQP